MIQWIALAVALDAENKANNIQDAIGDLDRRSRVSGDSFLIVRPVDIEIEWVPDGKYFGIFPKTKEVWSLAKKPYGTFSIRRSDILNLREYEAGGVTYVWVGIHEESADIYLDGRRQRALRIPGTIEQVTAVLNGQASEVKS